NAPTTVLTDGRGAQVYVGFDGGFTSAKSDPNSTLDYLQASLTVYDSGLFNGMIGMGSYTGSLIVGDVGTARADTYTIRQVSAPPPVNLLGYVTRLNNPVYIYYQFLGSMDLKFPSEDDTIDLQATQSQCNTSVDTGDGNNTILVGDPIQIG